MENVNKNVELLVSKSVKKTKCKRGKRGKKGHDGDKGDPGSRGRTGATGNTGETGNTGNTGNTGVTGNTGNTGVTGATGSVPLQPLLVFVQTNGNDATGVLQDPNNPFLTLQGAINAITALPPLPGDTWTIILGDGNFGPGILSSFINVTGLGSASVIGPINSGTGTGTSSIINVTIVGASPAITTTGTNAMIIRDCLITNIASPSDPQEMITLTNSRLVITDCVILYTPVAATGPINLITSSGSNPLNFSMKETYIRAVIPATTDSSPFYILDHSNSSVLSMLNFAENVYNINVGGGIRSTSIINCNLGSNGLITSRNEIIIETVDNTDNLTFYFNDSASTINASGNSITLNGTPASLFMSQNTSSGSTLTLNMKLENIDGPLRYNPFAGTTKYSVMDQNGSLWYTGGQSIGTRYSITSPVQNDDRTIIANVSGMTINLPKATDINKRILLIKPNVGVSDVQIIPFLGDTIDGATQYTIKDERDSIELQSDGVNTWNRNALTEPLLYPIADNLTVYIRTLADGGSDNNNGFTPLTPVLTLVRALEIISEVGFNNSAIIDIGAGIFPVLPSKAFSFDKPPRGGTTGAYIFRGAAPSVVSSKTVVFSNLIQLTPSQQTSINVSGGGLIPDQYKGLYIEVTSGVLAGNKYQISTNTATDIYILATVTFSPGDTFDIKQNTTIISYTGNRFSDGVVIMQNLDIILNDSIDPTITFSFACLDLFIIPDNIRFIAAAASVNPVVLLYGNTIVDSSNSSIFDTTFVPNLLGIVFDGSQIPNPTIITQILAVNSYVSMGKIYLNRSGFALQNSQYFGQYLYFDTCQNLQIGMSLMSAQNIVIDKSGGSGGSYFCQINTDAFLGIDQGLLRNGTSGLFNIDSDSGLFVNNSVINGWTGLINSNTSSTIIFSGINIMGITVNSSTLHDSSVTFSNCPTINFSNVDLNFDTCRVGIDNTIISGCFVSYTSCNLNTNNYTHDSTREIRLVSCTVDSNNMTIRNVSTDAQSMEITTTKFTESGILAILSSLAPSWSILSRSSNFDISTLLLVNTKSFNLTQTVVQVQNYNIVGLAAGFPNVLTRSTFTINNMNPDTQDTPWQLDNTQLNVTNMNHTTTAIAGGVLFSCTNSSNLSLNNCIINDTLATIVSLINSSASIVNSTVNNAVLVIFSSTFNNIYVNGCTFGTTIPLTDSIMNISNGKIDIENTISNSSHVNYGYYMSNIIGRIINCTSLVTSGNGNGLQIEKSSDIQIDNCVISGNAVNSGIFLSNSRYEITNTSVNNYNDGISIHRNAKGFIANTTGGTNLNYGVVLMSGSSFANQRDNTITGTTGDVNLGAAGTKSWALVNGGLAANTTDWPPLFDPSEYVYISPST